MGEIPSGETGKGRTQAANVSGGKSEARGGGEGTVEEGEGCGKECAVKCPDEQMTLGQGVLITVVASALFVPLWCAFRSRAFRYSAAAVFPFLLAFGLYWGPDFKHFQDTEYRAWEGLFISFCFVPGVLTSLALTFCCDLWKRKRNSQK